MNTLSKILSMIDLNDLKTRNDFNNGAITVAHYLGATAQIVHKNKGYKVILRIKNNIRHLVMTDLDNRIIYFNGLAEAEEIVEHIESGTYDSIDLVWKITNRFKTRR